MGLTVGIDLGTTYSVVAYIDPEPIRQRSFQMKWGRTRHPLWLCLMQGEMF